LIASDLNINDKFLPDGSVYHGKIKNNKFDDTQGFLNWFSLIECAALMSGFKTSLLKFLLNLDLLHSSCLNKSISRCCCCLLLPNFLVLFLNDVTAGVANHIGHGTSTFAEWAQENVYHKAIAHGLSQGAMSQISGGNFKEGFLGGAFSSYAGDSWLDASSNNVITDTMISSVIGGVSAELGGGKFVNGARSAATPTFGIVQDLVNFLS
jgi:hypothetical protein